MRYLVPYLIVTTAAAIGLFFLGMMLSDQLTFAVKTIPALCLAGIVFMGGEKSMFSTCTGIGLIFCALGDLFLECGDSFFLPGMGAFAAGHLSFAYALVLRDRTLHLPLLVILALWGGVVVGYIGDSLGDMKIPVMGYSIIISLVLWRSAAYFVSSFGTDIRGSYSLAAALLFAFSDSLIAINRFYFETPVEWARPIIMLTYWGALVFFAKSTFRVKSLE